MKFQDALRAALEVLPPSRKFTGLEAGASLEASASDFEALENLRALAFAEKVARPRQLSLWDEN